MLDPATTTPVVCDMTFATDTRSERLGEYQRLFTRALLGRERTTDGIRFRLRADDGIEAWVRDLAAREKACCGFFDFRIHTGGGQLKWDIAVIDDETARAVLDEFYALPDTVCDGVEGLGNRLRGRGLRVGADPSGAIAEVGHDATGSGATSG